jgi:hypothetical protein
VFGLLVYTAYVLRGALYFLINFLTYQKKKNSWAPLLLRSHHDYPTPLG